MAFNWKISKFSTTNLSFQLHDLENKSTGKKLSIGDFVLSTQILGIQPGDGRGVDGGGSSLVRVSSLGHREFFGGEGGRWRCTLVTCATLSERASRTWCMGAERWRR